MKKLINASTTCWRRASSGFGAAHADLVRRCTEPNFVRRAAADSAGKVALISGGGSGHEPLHGGLRRHRHARCRLPRPGVHLADARPDAGRGPGGRRRRRRAVHRQELRRRRDELRDGAPRCCGGDTPPSSPTTTSRSRTRPTPRAAAASPGTLIVEKIVGAAAEAGADLAALQGAGRAASTRRTRSMGVALTSCTVPAAGKPTFAHRRRRDGDGRRHPRRARPPPRQAASRPTPSPRRWSTAIRGDLGAKAGGRGAAAGQRLRRHAADGALSDVRRRPPAARASAASRSRARWSATTAPRSTWPAARSP